MPLNAGPDRITRFGYDVLDRQTRVTAAYGTAEQADETTVTYYGNGPLATITDARGNKTTYIYDGQDRLQEVHYPLPSTPGSSSSTDYEGVIRDANGNVTFRRLRDGNTITYAYDALNRVTTKTPPALGYLEMPVDYSYDLLGHLLTARSGTGGWLANSFAYDALGRLTTDAKYDGATYNSYDTAGRLTRLTYTDGSYVSYEYDAAGNMTAIRDSAGALLASFGYDSLGRRTSLTRANGVVTSYGYDAVSRLASQTLDLAGTAKDQSYTFTYNPAGEIASRTASNDSYAWTGGVKVDRTYTTNGLNQYTAAGATGFGYDGRGNLTSSGATTYAYTGENRLWSAAGATLVYEPSGGELLEVYSSNGDQRFVTAGGRIVEEFNATPWQLTRRYVPGPGADETIVAYDAGGTKSWLIADERGSIVAATDASGTATATAAYDEYGIPSGGNVGRFGYTGQAFLPEIGLSYYKARMYSPTLGRFMQTDPIGYADGMNWYNYVGSNPVNATDPSGLEGSPHATKVCQDDGTDCPDIVVTAKFVKWWSAFAGAAAARASFVWSGITGFLGTHKRQYDWHYGRNRYNHPPRTKSEAIRKGWIKQSDAKSLYHRFGPNGAQNTKYLSPDGHQEAVYDGNGNLVTSPENMGTYNYSPPEGVTGNLGHVVEDVIPYWILGNSPNDSTSAGQRVFGP